MGAQRRHTYIRRVLLGIIFVGTILGVMVGLFYQAGLQSWLSGRITVHSLLSKHQSLWLVRRQRRHSKPCVERPLHSTDASPCLLPDACLVDTFKPWSEWKACKGKQWARRESTRTSDIGPGKQNKSQASLLDASTEFDAFIVKYRDTLPWSLQSNYTAVLLEFRPLKRRLYFSINNAMDNLPVDWRIQVVGGARICNATRMLFPVEVEAGKIVLTDIGDRRMSQSRVSQILTDPEFYEHLLGETWLFFQYDSVICSKQRHLIKKFVETKRGWWGAPWSHWTREPKIGGNGGFSLRAKEFIFRILEQFPWTADQRPEDWYFCNVAADIYDELPDRLKPATFEEEATFSSEMMYSEATFGVHQYWTSLSPTSPRLRKMFANCPEMWDILPLDILKRRPDWRTLVCSMDVAQIYSSSWINAVSKLCKYEKNGAINS